LTDRAYFEALEPQLFMKQLSLTGQIGRDLAAFTEDLATAQNVIGDALTRIEGKLDNANEKLDRLIDQLVPKTGASEEETQKIKHTIAEMLLSDRQASLDAVTELMADPAQPTAATNRLKQAIAEQSDARKEATRNEIALLEEIVAINYFTNGPEAVSALEKITMLSPDDANSWNRLGLLQKRLGNLVAKTRGDLDGAVRYYEQSLSIETELGRKEGMATNYGNLGNVAQTRGDLDGAVRYHEQSLSIETELGRRETALDLFTQVGAAPHIATVSGWLKALDEAEDG